VKSARCRGFLRDRCGIIRMISIYFLVETSPPTCYNTRLCREYTLWPFCDINNSHGVPPRRPACLGEPISKYGNRATTGNRSKIADRSIIRDEPFRRLEFPRFPLDLTIDVAGSAIRGFGIRASWTLACPNGRPPRRDRIYRIRLYGVARFTRAAINYTRVF